MIFSSEAPKRRVFPVTAPSASPQATILVATSMVACGDADGAVTGNTRRFGASLEKIKQVVNARKGEIMFGLNMIVHKGKTIFIGDTSVHEYPTSEQMAEMAISTAIAVDIAISAICSDVGYS